MTDFDDLAARILDILPNASFDEDNNGQFIIHTGLVVTDDDEIVDFDIDRNDK